MRTFVTLPREKWRRTLSGVLATLAAGAVLGISIVAITLAPADAIEAPTVALVNNSTSASVNFRGGLSASVSLTPGTTQYGQSGAEFLSTTPHSAYGASSSMFSPALNPTSVPTFGLQAYSGMCGDVNYSGFCAGNATMTVTFNQPVTNPVLDVSGLGGNAYCIEDGEDQTGGGQDSDCNLLQSSGITIPANANNDLTAGGSIASQLTITTPGVSFTSLSPGNSNLAITATTLTAANKAGNFRCDTTAPTMDTNNTYPLNVQTTAGCGSVMLQGTFQTVTFSVGTHLLKFPTASGWTTGYNISKNGSALADLFRISIRLSEDMGDAPSSYDLVQGATHVQGPLRLGSSYTPDAQDTTNPLSSPNAGSGANLDTDDAINDGIRANAAARATPYKVTVPLSGTSQAGTLSGWIDFNKNGLFDLSERVQTTYIAGATSATLTWNVPSGATLGDTYMRLRTSFTATEVLNPTGIARTGEVEDYILRIETAAPAILVVKKVNGQDANTAPGASVLPGSTMNFTFDVTNTGNVTLTGVTLADNVIPGASIVPPAGWTGTLDPGQTVQFTATRTAPTGGNVLHTNTATVQGTPPSGVTPSPVTDTDPANATTTVIDARLSLEKSASVVDVDGDGVTGLGDHILYTFDVTNIGTTTVNTIAIVDNLLSQQQPPITVTCTPTSLVPQQISHCVANAPYVIKQPDVDAKKVINTAYATGTNIVGAPVKSNDDSTGTPVEPFQIPLEIEKIGEDSYSTWVRMDGSSFQILADVNGAPGAALPFTLIDVSTGLFRIDDFPAGTYWLTELTAPDGFSLLAEPVRFVINPDRTVSILANGGEAVTATGKRITVRDVPAVDLPSTGGAGAMPFTLAGSLMVLVASGLALTVRRRNSRPLIRVRRV